MDEIRIENLKIYAYHGVFAEENRNGQNFYVNVTMEADLQHAGLTDELEETISYAEVCEVVRERMLGRTCSLIEAAAEDLSTELFRRYDRLQKAEIEIRKPEAPIDADFTSVSVKIRRSRHVAYIAYGSNMGDIEKQIDEGIRQIGEDPMCRIRKASEKLTTTPYGGVAEGNFCNGILEIETLYTPRELLRRLHEIEASQGRERKEHWGSRTLDLDIIFYDDMILDSEDLVIPHPDMQNRDFVVVPMAEIAPYYRHPLLKKTMSEMCKEITSAERHILS